MHKFYQYLNWDEWQWTVEENGMKTRTGQYCNDWELVDGGNRWASQCGDCGAGISTPTADVAKREQVIRAEETKWVRCMECASWLGIVLVPATKPETAPLAPETASSLVGALSETGEGTKVETGMLEREP